MLLRTLLFAPDQAITVAENVQKQCQLDWKKFKPSLPGEWGLTTQKRLLQNGLPCTELYVMQSPGINWKSYSMCPIQHKLQEVNMVTLLRWRTRGGIQKPIWLADESYFSAGGGTASSNYVWVQQDSAGNIGQAMWHTQLCSPTSC